MRVQPSAHFWVHCILTGVGIRLCSFIEMASDGQNGDGR